MTEKIEISNEFLLKLPLGITLYLEKSSDIKICNDFVNENPHMFTIGTILPTLCSITKISNRIGKSKIITLCGSTKFKDQFMEAQKNLTLQGNIVISVGLFGHSGDNEAWAEGTKIMLDEIHKRKIDLSDEIFVINVGGYIGSSTKNEIEYAKEHGKMVNYLEKN